MVALVTTPGWIRIPWQPYTRNIFNTRNLITERYKHCHMNIHHLKVECMTSVDNFGWCSNTMSLLTANGKSRYFLQSSCLGYSWWKIRSLFMMCEKSSNDSISTGFSYVKTQMLVLPRQ